MTWRLPGRRRVAAYRRWTHGPRRGPRSSTLPAAPGWATPAWRGAPAPGSGDGRWGPTGLGRAGGANLGRVGSPLRLASPPGGFERGADALMGTRNFGGVTEFFTAACVAAFHCRERTWGASTRSRDVALFAMSRCSSQGASKDSSTAFCAWRRFSACCHTALAGPSSTSSEISSPRWAGRQCSTMADGLAAATTRPSKQ